MAKITKLCCLYSSSKFPGRPAWMHGFSQAPNTIVLEDRVRLFICCRPKPDPNGMYISRFGYIDLAKDDPTKVIGFSPDAVLALGQTGEFDEFGTYPVSVYKENRQRLIAAYGGWTRCRSVPFDISIGLAISNNAGETFQRFGSGPILTKSLLDPFVITSPKLRKYNGKWYLFYTCGTKWITDKSGRPEIIYKIKVATSNDLLNWNRDGDPLIETRLGKDEAQACPDVVQINGKFHMFYCYRRSLDFRKNLEGTYRIGHAISEDLYNWRITSLADDFTPSFDGFDNEMVAYPNVFELNNNFFLIYAGNGNGREGIGIAKVVGLDDVEV